MKLFKGYPGRPQGPLFRETASNKDQFLEGCNWSPQVYISNESHGSDSGTPKEDRVELNGAVVRLDSARPNRAQARETEAKTH